MLNTFRAGLFGSHIPGADGSCRKEWHMGIYNSDERGLTCQDQSGCFHPVAN